MFINFGILESDQPQRELRLSLNEAKLTTEIGPSACAMIGNVAAKAKTSRGGELLEESRSLFFQLSGRKGNLISFCRAVDFYSAGKSIKALHCSPFSPPSLYRFLFLFLPLVVPFFLFYSYSFCLVIFRLYHTNVSFFFLLDCYYYYCYHSSDCYYHCYPLFLLFLLTCQLTYLYVNCFISCSYFSLIIFIILVITSASLFPPHRHHHH